MPLRTFLPLARCAHLLRVALVLCLLGNAAWAAEPRLALLIGNAAYARSPLANPVNDVRLMEAALREAGFDIIKAENATRRQMLQLVREFGDRLRQSGGVGLFYFAGHGVQVRGNNYLIPVDADIVTEDEVAFDSLDAQAVLEKMESARNRVNLLILDACRDNPFSRTRSMSAGLATMNAPTGSLVAYATAPGAVASDGNRSNGLYTGHLARVLRTPGLAVEDVFKQVRAAVRRDSRGQQVPWENTALEGQFYFLPPTAGVAAPATPAAPSPDDVALWERVRSSTVTDDLQLYLDRFPQGLFADVARLRLQSLQDLPPAAAAPAAALAAPVAPAMAAALPSASVSTVAPAAPTAARGILTLRDRLTGRETFIEVAGTRLDDGSQRWLSGEEVAPDGTLRALRLGTQTGRLGSGTLWQFPLRPGAAGEATLRMADGSRALLNWRVLPRDGEHVPVEATLQIEFTGAADPRTQRGTWFARYLDGLAVPSNFTLDLRAPIGGADRLSGQLRLDGR